MPKHWWVPLVLVVVFGSSGVLFMGIKAYQEAPPIPDFKDEAGGSIVSSESILEGQAVFQQKNLMDYGSMFGDGANRGPDFTADALHRMVGDMREYHIAHPGPGESDLPEAARASLAEARTGAEIKENRFRPADNTALLGPAQAYAYGRLIEHYGEMFAGAGPEAFHPAGYVKDPGEIRALASFFFWGAWVCGTKRPGYGYTYTQNWPYDEGALNVPTKPTLLWSVVGLFALILALGAVLFAYGRADKTAGMQPRGESQAPLGPDAVDGFRPSPTQRATYKFFAIAAFIFVLQVLGGILAIHDFVGFTHFFGVDLSTYLPITVSRGWHLVLAVLWITACWMGGSIFILPLLTRREIPGQLKLINALFALLIIVTAGSLAGIFMGPMGLLGKYWRLAGSQGWEFMELGRIWQVGLFAALILWAVIVVRGSWPALQVKRPFALPYWLIYSIIAVAALFLSSFVATPRTNFAIADFWRWMVVHMWAECFLEVFTTVVVSYFLVLMGLVTEAGAARTTYFAALLFLGSGILGISHNFYWSAKPVVTLALGSVFSTLQVVPLILLSLEAWKVYNMPGHAIRRSYQANGGQRPTFGLSAAFLFLLGVNFWNFMGAGVLGFIINLPIVNYYEHGTYLTVNHGHTAFMGVYGNLSLAAVVFCSRFLIRGDRWNEGLVRLSFWSLNIGLALMALLDLFPAGIAQLVTVLQDGYQAARSQAFIQSPLFQTLTWMRILGGSLFFLGGVIPLTAFLALRWGALKDAGKGVEGIGSGLDPAASADLAEARLAPARAGIRD